MSDLPTQDELTSLDGLIAQWDGFQNALAVAQETVKRLNAEITKLETDLIPGLMASAGGIEKFKLEDGREVALRDELYASITEANRPGAFAWLEEHGYGDVIKDELKIMLGRGDTAKARAESLIAKAEAEGITDYSRKRAVAPNTLQALLKEQLAEGADVPKELFGVYQQRRAIIKLPKGAK